jgi:hypothetical protein
LFFIIFGEQAHMVGFFVVYPQALREQVIERVLARIFHKLHVPSLVFCFVWKFCSVGRMNNYATLSQNPPTKQMGFAGMGGISPNSQNPARSSREFMKYPG